MTAATDAPPTDIRTTAYRVAEGDRAAMIVWIRDNSRDLPDPDAGWWSVNLEHRHGFAVQDGTRPGRDDEVGPFMVTLGEVRCPTADDVEPQLQLAIGYARELLAIERAHDARLREAYAETSRDLTRARTRAGCIDR